MLGITTFQFKKDQFEKIKQDVQVEQDKEKTTQGRQAFGEIGDKETVLVNRINALKELLNDLEGTYTNGKTELNDFKEVKDKISNIYEEYKDYLKESGINSKEDILNNNEFSQESDVIDYHEKGAAKLKDQNKRGDLGEAVTKIYSAKQKAKEILPEEQLNFRGGKGADSEMSPRQESIQKIKFLINKLEQEELTAIEEKKAIAKAEYLPHVEELIAHNLDKLFSKGYHPVESDPNNLNFINDDVFRLTGQEMWPEVKEMAEKLILEKYKALDVKTQSLNVRNQSEKINASLEAEKMIFDVEEIRRNHEYLLELDQDAKSLLGLKNNIRHSNIFLSFDRKILIRDEKVCSVELIKNAESFVEKNPEAQQVCETAKAELLTLYQLLKEKINPGWLTKKELKEAAKQAKESIATSESKLEKLDIPEYFFNKNSYSFINELSDSCPYINTGNYDLLSSVKEELNNKSRKIINRVTALRDNDTDLAKLENNIYQLSSNHTGADKSFVKVGGFEIPALTLKQDYFYKSINDKESVDRFLAELEGSEFDEKNWEVKFSSEVSARETKIKDYPGGEQIITSFKKLQDEFDKKFNRDAYLIKAKMSAKEGLYSWQHYNNGHEIDAWKVKQELFTDSKDKYKN